MFPPLVLVAAAKRAWQKMIFGELNRAFNETSSPFHPANFKMAAFWAFLLFAISIEGDAAILLAIPIAAREEEKGPALLPRGPRVRAQVCHRECSFGSALAVSVLRFDFRDFRSFSSSIQML